MVALLDISLPILVITMITRVTIVEVSAGVATFYLLVFSFLTSPIRTHRASPANILKKSKEPTSSFIIIYVATFVAVDVASQSISWQELRYNSVLQFSDKPFCCKLCCKLYLAHLDIFV